MIRQQLPGISRSGATSPRPFRSACRVWGYGRKHFGNSTLPGTTTHGDLYHPIHQLTSSLQSHSSQLISTNQPLASICLHHLIHASSPSTRLVQQASGHYTRAFILGLHQAYLEGLRAPDESSPTKSHQVDAMDVDMIAEWLENNLSINESGQEGTDTAAVRKPKSPSVY